MIKSVFVFPNLNIAACDENGMQIPEIQTCPLYLWADLCVSKGLDPMTAVIETSKGKRRLIKDSEGKWNRERV